MNSALMSHLKTARAGVALFGIAAMLSMSACTPAPAPVPDTTTEPKPSATASAEVSATPSPTEEIDSTDENMTYPAPAVSGKTSVGEPVKDAEARFVTAVKKRVPDAGTDSKLLSMGYEVCGYYGESLNSSELFDKLEVASNGDHDTEVLYVYISGAAANTLCPEHTDFE